MRVFFLMKKYIYKLDLKGMDKMKELCEFDDFVRGSKDKLK